MHGTTRTTLGAMIALALAMPATAAPIKSKVAADQLAARTGAKLSISPATGTARFMRAPRGKALGVAGAQKRADHAMAFLKANGNAFGLRDATTELKLQGVREDKLGDSRVSYLQSYRGVPVFGASLAVHYDKQGNLKAVNGVVVPDITLDTVPRTSQAQAGAVALKQVKGSDVAVRGTRLLVFREGLLKGVPGANHLAYEVEVGNGTNVREFVYVDANNGAKIDQITGIVDAMNRRAYNGLGLPQSAIPTFYPGTPFWVEGQSLPTTSVEADNMIISSKETYDFFYNAFGRDSFDGAGKTMDAIFNRGYSCPNASWNGTFISFCPGLTVDDVTAHEWSHAYTQYTHGLIYQWQSGALNEAYSDIWGETVDRINGRGGDVPLAQREEGACSIQWGSPPASLVVNSPASIAGPYNFARAQFGAQNGTFTGNLQFVNDGVAATGGTATDACEPLVGFTPGNIALVDRGLCGFVVKVKNAQNAGASAVVVANLATSAFGTMGGVDATITIPSVLVTYTTGNLFKANAPVNATLAMPVSTDNSVRWLIGEDSTATGLVGALRDMWNPTCFGNPGKVSDSQYYCATTASSATDQGGVHLNSGVPNHGYALLVDGGTYNGETITGLGLTKAAQIYFRAQSVYQNPASDFADHADSLEQSCSDLIGAALPDLQTGGASSSVISADDCSQLAKVVAAVELRTPPTQCGFEPVLFQNPPPLCPSGTTPSNFFASNFDAGDSTADRWTTTHAGVNPATFIPRDWQLVGAGQLPDGRAGRGFWAADPSGTNANCALSAPNHAGVISLFSPIVTVAKSVSDARLSFEHWVATEPGYDGGNLKISVNGGPWTQVSDTNYEFNGYNGVLYPTSSSWNPLAGQAAFTGTDGGSVGGSWGRSTVNLAPYAPAGSKVQLRFDLGTDECGGNFGWYLDDVNMYTCKRKK
jgi:bacillolysin